MLLVAETKSLLPFQNQKRSNSFARILYSHLFDAYSPSETALQNCIICYRCVTVKHVIRSHFICCMVNTWPGLLEPPEHGKIRQSSGPKQGAENSRKWKFHGVMAASHPG